MIEEKQTFDRPTEFRVPNEEMDLLDYFAGQALSGLSSIANNEPLWNGGDDYGVAVLAYGLAKGMMTHRQEVRSEMAVKPDADSVSTTRH